jgi:hypothetical protein
MTKQIKLDRKTRVFLNSIKDPKRQQRFITYLIELNSLYLEVEKILQESKRKEKTK